MVEAARGVILMPGESSGSALVPDVIRRAAVPTIARARTRADMRMGPAEGLSGRRILVVEDDEAVARLYARRFKECGSIVELVTTADAAIELLGQFEFDLVTLDLELANATPVSLVLDFLEERDLDPAVVVITAHSDIERMRELMPYRVAAFHAKAPGVLDNLPQIVSSILETRDLKRRLRASESNLLAIYAGSPFAMGMVDPVGRRFVEANPALQGLIGARYAEVTAAVPQPFVEALITATMRAAQERAPVLTEFTRIDGTRVLAEVAVNSVDRDGSTYLVTHIRDVTEVEEKRRAQQEVESARSRLEFFIDNSDLMICFIDPEGRIAEWNRSAKVRLGFPASTMQGRYFWDILHGSERQAIRSRWTDIVEERYMGGRWFATLKGAERQTIATEWNHKTVRDESGRALGVLAVGEVVSRERESELRARALFDGALSCIAFLDARTYRIIDINPAGAASFACQPDGCTGRDFLEFFAPAERELLRSKLTATAEEPVSGHAQAVRTDGSTFQLGYRASRIAGSGRPMVLIVGRDLSDVHRAETRYQALFTRVPTPLLIVSRDEMKVIDCNPAFERLVGYGAEELREMTSSDLHGESEGANVATLLRAGEPLADVTEQVHETSLLRKDGSSVLVRMRTSSFELDQTPAFISFVVDVTEEVAAKNRERELERALIQAQKMEMFGQIGSGIAHEFNNVLMAAMPWAEILERGRRTEEQTTNAARSILAALRRGRDVARQMLGLARPQQPTIASVPVMPVIRDQVSMLRPAIPREINIEFEASDESLVVRADASQLNQVLLNLALNARDAMPEGGTLRIEVRSLRPLEVRRWGFSASEYLLIVVSDTGSGIPHDVAMRVFDPFFTTKDIGKGSGLGLSVVHRIINQHGGMIFLDSFPGAGTTFYLLLPRAVPLSHHRGGQHDEPGLRCDGRSFLIVDDEASVTSGVRAMLEADGAIVSTVSRGKTALELIDKGLRPDFVILDLGLPEMKGEDVHLQIRRRLPDLPIIIASGYGEIDRVRPLLADRFTRFRQKPYELVELLNLVRELDRERAGDGLPRS